MVLWVVLKNKDDAKAFENAFDVEERQAVLDNVWLVYHNPPEDTPNPCEHFRDEHEELMAGFKGQVVVGYLQAIAGFGEAKFAEQIEKWAARTEEDGQAAGSRNGGDAES